MWSLGRHSPHPDSGDTPLSHCCSAPGCPLLLPCGLNPACAGQEVPCCSQLHGHRLVHKWPEDALVSVSSRFLEETPDIEVSQDPGTAAVLGHQGSRAALGNELHLCRSLCLACPGMGVWHDPGGWEQQAGNRSGISLQLVPVSEPAALHCAGEDEPSLSILSLKHAHRQQPRDSSSSPCRDVRDPELGMGTSTTAWTTSVSACVVLLMKRVTLLRPLWLDTEPTLREGSVQHCTSPQPSAAAAPCLCSLCSQRSRPPSAASCPSSTQAQRRCPRPTWPWRDAIIIPRQRPSWS